MAAVTPGLEAILSALQAGAGEVSGPGAGDEPSGADTGPQEAAEPLPPGHFVSAGQITATLLEAFPVSPALAAALAEVIAQVLAANAEAQRAWDQVGRQADAKMAALEDAAVLRRNWHDDRDKLVALRRWAEKNLRGRTLDGILAVFQQVTGSGPFESEREVRQLQAVRDIYLAFEADPGAMSSGLWCDTFDADLLKVVPGAEEALGDTAAIELLTYSNPTNGKINCPSAWHTDEGLVSFFWTDPAFRPPSGYVTSDPVVPCTFLEIIRDEWVHGQVVSVNRQIVWRPPERLMDRLMYDLRGWTVLSDADRAAIRGQVLAGLDLAARRFRVATGTPAGVAP